MKENNVVHKFLTTMKDEQIKQNWTLPERTCSRFRKVYESGATQAIFKRA
jgi:hypothetical protein